MMTNVEFVEKGWQLQRGIRLVRRKKRQEGFFEEMNGRRVLASQMQSIGLF